MHDDLYPNQYPFLLSLCTCLFDARSHSSFDLFLFLFPFVLLKIIVLHEIFQICDF